MKQKLIRIKKYHLTYTRKQTGEVLMTEDLTWLGFQITIFMRSVSEGFMELLGYRPTTATAVKITYEVR